MEGVPNSKRQRTPKMTSNQFEVLVDYMVENPDLASGRLTINFTAEDRNSKWADLACRLNADRSGVRKSVQKWRKCWNDQKSQVRAKAARVEKSRLQIGDKVSYESLTPTEEKMMELVGWTHEERITPDPNDFIEMDTEPGISISSVCTILEEDVDGVVTLPEEQNVDNKPRRIWPRRESQNAESSEKKGAATSSTEPEDHNMTTAEKKQSANFLKLMQQQNSTLLNVDTNFSIVVRNGMRRAAAEERRAAAEERKAAVEERKAAAEEKKAAAEERKAAAEERKAAAEERIAAALENIFACNQT